MLHDSPPPRKLLWPVLLSILIALCMGPYPVAGQSDQTQTQPTMPYPRKPIPRPILYRTFLTYQNHLDTLAAKKEVKGEDGSWLRNDLQKRLGFSDADFAPIRVSSQRLAAELSDLDAQAKASRGGSFAADQLKALAAKRDAYVKSEMDYLGMSLTTQNKNALEIFLKLFFSPKDTNHQISVSGSQLQGSGVQK